MSLTLQISEWPLWQAGLLLVVLPTLLSMCGPILVRRLLGLNAVIGNNEVAGFKFATLGVIYAVLLGLAVIAASDTFSEADTATTREAAALASLFRLAGGLDTQPQLIVHEATRRYARATIDNDWPAMARGAEDPQARVALNDLYNSVFSLDLEANGQSALLSSVLSELNVITEMRRLRLSMAEGIIRPIVWLVLLAGAAMTIGFTFFFGLENLRAQALMTGMLAMLIFLALFVAISVNHPFTGAIVVAPEPIELVLVDFAEPP